jgi:hypothetical protein
VNALFFVLLLILKLTFYAEISIDEFSSVLQKGAHHHQM